MNTEHARDRNVSDLPPTPPFPFQVAPWQSSTIVFQLELIFDDWNVHMRKCSEIITTDWNRKGSDLDTWYTILLASHAALMWTTGWFI